MIALNKSEIFKIISYYLTQLHQQVPISIKLSLDWNCFKYDKSQSEWIFTTNDVWENVIKYSYIGNYGTPQTKFLNLQRITEYVIKEYPEVKSIDVSVRVKDDKKLHITKSVDDVMSLASVEVKVIHDDNAKLEESDLKELIDYALMINDRQWFNDLTTEYYKTNIHSNN